MSYKRKVIYMPLPKVKKNESKKKFLPRCMSEEIMTKDFKDIKQRYAVCLNIWKDKDKKKD